VSFVATALDVASQRVFIFYCYRLSPETFRYTLVHTLLCTIQILLIAHDFFCAGNLFQSSATTLSPSNSRDLKVECQRFSGGGGLLEISRPG